MSAGTASPGLRSPITTAVLRAIEAAPAGLRFSQLRQQFSVAEAPLLHRSIKNLRVGGRVHRVVEVGNLRNGLYRAGPGPHFDDAGEVWIGSGPRRMDERHPIVFYGQALPAPRAASVWAYARALGAGGASA